MDVTFNPYVNNTLVYAYHNEAAVARLHLPSNSVGVDQGTSAMFERDIYQRLVITPQNDLSLEDKTNHIRDAAQAYTNQFY